MRCFVEVQTVTIGKGLRRKAQEFSLQVVPTVGEGGTGYGDSQQHSLSKIQQDHYISKLGEEAARIAFERSGKKVLGPDYQIYLPHQKSWAPDLTIDGVALAVKSQSSAIAQRYGLSWTFQSSAVRADPILQQPDAWVCFVEVNLEHLRCRVYPPYQIQELTFALPQVERLKSSKKVVYAHDLVTQFS